MVDLESEWSRCRNLSHFVTAAAAYQKAMVWLLHFRYRSRMDFVADSALTVCQKLYYLLMMCRTVMNYCCQMPVATLVAKAAQKRNQLKLMHRKAKACQMQSHS